MSLLKLKELNNRKGVPLVHSTYNNDFLNRLIGDSISFWIDSSGGPKELCNKSFYGTDPKYYIYGSLNEVNFVDCCRDVPPERLYINCFDFLEEKLQEEKANTNGVFVGYIAYDLFSCRNAINRVSTYPDFFFAYFDKMHDVKDRQDLSCRYRAFDGALCSNMTDSEYLEKVKQIKAEIKAGNVYQVNLTREYSIQMPDVRAQMSELDIYLKLRSLSPNPYGCFFKTPLVNILSSSPEEFLYIKDDYIRTRPIKGTLPKSEFNIDPKNKAENIMIVDLERNDLGKICEYGSVKAEKLLEIESYEHLNHVVSTVEGKLKPDTKLKQIFEALFPSGSITGAPKIAAMKIINEIESTKRGAYTGTFGYIRTDGTMNFNILIRTIFVHNGKITFNIGGGIVADSDPQGELDEINLKAKGIISALQC